MKAATAVRRSWFYHFVRALALAETAFYAAVLIDLLLHPLGPDLAGHPAAIRLGEALLSAPAILVLGVLVLRRARGNLIGWLLVLWGAQVGAGAVRVEAFGGYAAELSQLSLVLWPVLWAIPLHFPDGEPHPRRLGWVAQGVIAATIVLFAFTSYSSPVFDTSIPLRAGTPNRFYVPQLSPLSAIVSQIVFVPLLSMVGMLIVSIALRFRASRGRERQQLKYMLGVAVLLVSIVVTGSQVGLFTTSPSALTGWARVASDALGVVITLLPAAGIALPILRHRLYNIDIIIRRTVTYAVVTALLLAVYFGGVVLLQRVFVALTGQRSEAAIILSTLVIAALFVPLRNGIQAVIDRRFFRRKYDAAKVLESFARTARDETDLGQLSTRLLDVVDETLQPVEVSLWLQTVGDQARVSKEGQS